MNITDNANKKFVIIDTDMGTDDAWALLMLAKADFLENIKILAITCVAGNTALEDAIKNTYHILHTIGRTDV